MDEIWSQRMRITDRHADRARATCGFRSKLETHGCETDFFGIKSSSVETHKTGVETPSDETGKQVLSAFSGWRNCGKK
jgi:hypothetical protein